LVVFIAFFETLLVGRFSGEWAGNQAAGEQGKERTKKDRSAHFPENPVARVIFHPFIW